MVVDQSEIKPNLGNNYPKIVNKDNLETDSNNIIPIDKILYCKSMTKIIKFLAEHHESNITLITKSCGINHKTVRNHIKFLEDAQIITIKKYGRIIIYSLNEDNQNSKIVSIFKEYAFLNQKEK